MFEPTPRPFCAQRVAPVCQSRQRSSPPAFAPDMDAVTEQAASLVRRSPLPLRGDHGWHSQIQKLLDADEVRALTEMDVAALLGGTEAWVAAGLPTQSGAEGLPAQPPRNKTAAASKNTAGAAVLVARLGAIGLIVCPSSSARNARGPTTVHDTLSAFFPPDTKPGPAPRPARVPQGRPARRRRDRSPATAPVRAWPR